MRDVPWITYAVMAAVVVIPLACRIIERTLELASWAMVAFIFVFLEVAKVLFVPAAHGGRRRTVS